MVLHRLRAFALILGCVLPAACAGPAIDAAEELPTRHVAGRFFAEPVTTGGDTLRFFTDTGGGLFLYPEVAESLGLSVDRAGTAPYPEWQPGRSIPGARGFPGGTDRIPVVDPGPAPGEAVDGMLGQAWFADRVWTFDYPGRRLWLHPDRSATGLDPDRNHTVALGFRSDSAGRRTAHFPRIRIAVDGDSLDLLFDTGATIRPTDSARTALGTEARAAATSFIVTEVLDRWVERHPDWLVVGDAERPVEGVRMIRVPKVSVAGWEVGPVWFTERPNRSFRGYMAQYMDRPVDGALGGSALRYFRVTVSYPEAYAWFRRPAG